jgi:hypothetical protein
MSPRWAGIFIRDHPLGLPNRAARRVFGLLPSPRRCKFCNAPFRGPYAGAVKRTGYARYTESAAGGLEVGIGVASGEANRSRAGADGKRRHERALSEAQLVRWKLGDPMGAMVRRKSTGSPPAPRSRSSATRIASVLPKSGVRRRFWLSRRYASPLRTPGGGIAFRRNATALRF